MHPRMMETLAKQLVSERSAGVGVTGFSWRRSRWSGGNRNRARELQGFRRVWFRLAGRNRSALQFQAIERPRGR